MRKEGREEECRLQLHVLPALARAPAWGSPQEAGTRRRGCKAPAWAGGREARDDFPAVPLGPPCPPPILSYKAAPPYEAPSDT